MPSDIEIAQVARPKPIVEIAKKLNITAEYLIPYGHYIAKLSPKLHKKFANYT